MLQLKRFFGPSTLIAAAFIGPGTLTTCTMAGVQSGYKLLWALAFAMVAATVLQEMSARLGLVTKEGLGESLRHMGQGRWLGVATAVLVISAIGIGNAAYESGNIAGTTLGAELVLGAWSGWPLAIGVLAGCLLLLGKYQWIERALITLVVVMTLCFLITAIVIGPSIPAILRGFMPTSLQSGDLLLAVALIGTTVVPYNLFLHASVISKKYNSETHLRAVRVENITAILLGGAISVLIVITAAASRESVSSISHAGELAVQLEPVLGQYAKYAIGMGLLAAGLSSTLTAPLATGYALHGMLGWSGTEQSMAFRATVTSVVLAGVLVAMLDVKLLSVIKFAQVTNAVLLPVIAGFLLWACNSKQLLGRYTNSMSRNIVAGLVLLICVSLSLRTFQKLFF